MPRVLAASIWRPHENHGTMLNRRNETAKF
jgi:hypothetical protein